MGDSAPLSHTHTYFEDLKNQNKAHFKIDVIKDIYLLIIVFYFTSSNIYLLQLLNVIVYNLFILKSFSFFVKNSWSFKFIFKYTPSL